MLVKAKAVGRTENTPEVGAQRDVTNPAEEGIQSQGHNHKATH